MLDVKELRYMQNTLPSENNLVHLIGLFLCSLGIAVQDGITKTSFYAAERVWGDAYDIFKEALEKDGFSVKWSKCEREFMVTTYDGESPSMVVIEVDWS